MCLTAILAGGSILGTALGADAANSAADAQLQASQEANALQREMWETSLEQNEPWLESSENALGVWNAALGIAPPPSEYTIEKRMDEAAVAPSQPMVMPGQYAGGNMHPMYGYIEPNHHAYKEPGYAYAGGGVTPDPTYSYYVGDQKFGTEQGAQDWINSQPQTAPAPYGGYQKSPGYEYQLAEAQDAVDNAYSSYGFGSIAGPTLAATTELATGFADQDFNNWLGQVGATANIGYNAASANNTLNTNYANAAGQNTLYGGQAQASGFANQANVFNQGLGDVSSLLMMDSMGMFAP